MSRFDYTEIDPEVLEASAKKKALDLLSRRSYSTQELFEKLSDRFGERPSAAAISRMQELDLLCDTDYALRYARHCIFTKGLSPLRAKQELRSKGISQDIIDDTLEQLDVDPRYSICRVILRKYGGVSDDEKLMRRINNTLARLGYNFSDIRAVIEDFEEYSKAIDNQDSTKSDLF